MKKEKKECPTYTDLDRLSLLRGYYSSGQTKASYSRSHGITASSINYWQRRFGVSDLNTITPLIEELNMPSKEE